jgi:Glycerophosphoryl diester phosphodiesterase family
MSVAQSRCKCTVCSCGENMLHSPGSAPNCKGVRENTIASFKQAAALNAGFIEFDVQVGTLPLPFLAWLLVLFHVVLVTTKLLVPSYYSMLCNCGIAIDPVHCLCYECAVAVHLRIHLLLLHMSSLGFQLCRFCGRSIATRRPLQLLLSLTVSRSHPVLCQLRVSPSTRSQGQTLLQRGL